MTCQDCILRKNSLVLITTILSEKRVEAVAEHTFFPGPRSSMYPTFDSLAKDLQHTLRCNRGIKTESFAERVSSKNSSAYL